MPGPTVRLEYDTHRKLRARNKVAYRFAHWPIWIAVFFLLPGPVTFRLFAQGFDWPIGLWLAAVAVGTGIAGLFGRLPGVEPRPYIIRFTEDRPNPLYRRICYTVAWSELICYGTLNLAGIIYACLTGNWRMAQLYHWAYLPGAVVIWTLGILGLLPRVKRSTKGEGHERRYFYGLMWAVPLAQACVWLLWRTLPTTAATNRIKLATFCSVLACMGWLAFLGVLPRTRKIVPGELAISD